MNNANRLIITRLNINSLPIKFNQLKLIINNKVDIIGTTGTKLDSSFPDSQLIINGFRRPHRFHRNRLGRRFLASY